MSFPRTIRNYNAFEDGVSYWGLIGTGKMPGLNLSTAAHRGAGMDAPIGQDMGMEALSAELDFKEWVPDIVRHFGTRKRLVFRPAAMGEDDFEADAWIFTCEGLISGVNWDDLKPGNEAMQKMKMDVRFFSAELNGEELFKIDIENGVRVIGGQDQMASMRRAMGI